MIEPRQSTTVPNVSKTSARGFTVGLASAKLDANSTAAPALKIFKRSLRCIVLAIDLPLRRQLFLRLVVEDIEYARGKIAIGFVPSGLEIFLPVLCPWPAIVVDIAFVAWRKLGRSAIDVDDIRQAFHERMAKSWAVETRGTSPMRRRS